MIILSSVDWQCCLSAGLISLKNNQISVFSETEKIGFIIFSIIYHRYRE